MTVLLLLALLAHGADHRVVLTGDTVESLAAAAGIDPDAVRAASGLAPGEQPSVGQIVVLPTRDEGAAVVTAVQGGGTISRPGEDPIPLASWVTLPAGTVVCTDANGYAAVRLAAADSCQAAYDVSLLSSTCLTIKATYARGEDRSSHVFLGRGSVSLSESRGLVALETRSGTTVSRHGGLRVTLEPDAARTEALVGDVAVIGAGVAVELGPNQGSRVHTGQAPSDPVALLLPGALDAPDDGAPLVRPDFAWAPVPGALGYRVALATGADFTELVRTEEIGHASWSPERLFLPYRRPGLYWRVAAFDRIGFLGPPTPPRRLRLPAGVGP